MFWWIVTGVAVVVCLLFLFAAPIFAGRKTLARWRKRRPACGRGSGTAVTRIA